MMRTSWGVLAAAVALSVTVVACSDGDDDDAATSDDTEQEERATDDTGDDNGSDAADDSGAGEDEAASDDPERQAYVDAFVASSSDDTLSEEENQCFGEAVVDSVGVDKLAEVITPDEVRESAGAVPSDLGVEVTEDEGEAFYDLVSECVDIEAMFAEGITGDDSVPEEAKECLVDEFDGEFLRGFYVSLYIQGSQGFANDEDLMNQMQAAYSECGITP
jgi:hypothetical protein